MRKQRRSVMGSRLILLSVMAMVGAALPALPAAAVDNVPAPPTPSAAPLPVSTNTVATPTDQFIVKFKDRAGIQAVDPQKSFSEAAEAIGVPVEIVRTTAAGEEVVKTDRKLGADQATALVATLAADPSVEYAEPDAIMQPLAVAPNDTYYSLQWGLGSGAGGINVLGAWDVSQGEGSVVAVVDSGILGHTDLDANVLPGYDMINDLATSRDGDLRDPNPRDEGDATYDGQCAAGKAGARSSWHGTHVAGIIAAVAGNGKGVAGVAPKAKIVPIRALGTCGGYTSDIADGIRWAAGGTVTGVPANANPARVINLSVGGRAACSATYQNAVNFARGQGAVVVVAAGNENIDASLISPANCSNVITVGASTKDNSKAYYSNSGENVDVTAPGGDMTKNAVDGIVSTLNNGADTATTEDYYLKSGTSMAAPHVAAVAAMMLSKLPALTPADVEQRLKSNARALASCTGGCGAGLVDANATLKQLAADAAPIVAGTPTITGEAAVGKTLTVDNGTWNNVESAEWTYQWNRWGVPVAGATDSSYTLVADDHQAAMTVTVTATKKYVPAVSATSEPTAQVGQGTLTGSVPVIVGSAYVGSTLTIDPGSWEPAPVEFMYAWTRNDPGTTGHHLSSLPSYTVTSEDVGKTITAELIGMKTPYFLLQMLSKPTPAVVPADKAVSPESVVFTEAPYMADDTYTVPESETVDYQVDGKTVDAGTHRARGQVKVTAQAKDGYALLNAATTQWSAYFSSKGPDFTAPTVSPFKDVLTSQQFYTEMSWLADRKISTGWIEADKSVTYRPLTPINRDAMAAFLYRMAGSPDYTPPSQSPFKDVLTTQQFYKEMSWLAETGISSGWTESDSSRTYRPLTPINRDAMAAFLYRLANKPDYVAPVTSPFRDVDPQQQFYKEMAWMAEKGISSGWMISDTDRIYQPLSPINRDAMAAFLYRMP
ncbi:S8 family serine peptidase [Paenarthrobacter sp. NPDC056912]|uniref:S8 family serine peptidase n=1 Tax=Paenarthrobacter sp. NPDC056912 TaxID=3345965 RepID=UPI00367149A7